MLIHKLPAITPQSAQDDWVGNYVRDATAAPPPVDLPAVAYTSHTTGDATTLTSPVVVKPPVVGTGAKTTGWTGATDTNFRYAGGVFSTDGGANGDAAVYGELKPGGDAQVATWPVLVSFTTSSATVEVAFRAKLDTITPMFSINGRLVSDINVSRSATGMYFTATLTFPSERTRTIQVLCGRELGFNSVRLPAGGTLSKPAAPKRRVAVIGDSYVNGAGSYVTNGGANTLESFAHRLCRLMGSDDQILAGIGGTGWVNGSTSTPQTHYGSRIDAVLAMNPHVMVFYGSINDGPSGVGVQAAVEAALARCTAVPEVYVVGPLLNGNDGNNAAVKSGTLNAGRVFVDLGRYLYGTGKVDSPKGDGNRDFYLMSDGFHPTFAGHKAIAERIFRGVYTR